MRLRNQGSLVGAIAIGAIALQAFPSAAIPANEVAPQGRIFLPSEINVADPNGSLAQVTSVSQLSDVRPTDWAFQALQSLVERYGCVVGYPDKTFRGNRALSRYEFAAGLNACMDRVNELIAASTADLVRKEDLEVLRKLMEEFAEDLAEIRGRVDALEARTATLEKQQFSTTTKLSGEIVFSLGTVWGDDRALDSDRWRRVEDVVPLRGETLAQARDRQLATEFAATGFPRKVQDNRILGDRVRLTFQTSFTGKDLLFTRLGAVNITSFNTPVTGTNMTRLSVDGTANLNNSVQMGKLFYRFPVGKKLMVTVDAIGAGFYHNVNVASPFLSSPVQGSISRFGRFSPIYRASNTASDSNSGTGITLNYKLTDALTLSAGYLAKRAMDPNQDRGLFDGTYSTLAQLTYQPNRNLILAATYAHSYFSGAANDVTVSGAYGSAFANSPFGAGFGSTAANPVGVATSANYFGLEASYRIAPWVAVSGWGLYTQAIAENGSKLATVTTGDKADIWSWALGLAFPDLLGKGNLGGLVIGMPPKVTRSDFGPTVLTPTTARREDSDTSIHLETFYRYQVTDNISITPGVILVFNPEHNANNPTEFAGVIRTTFQF